MTIELSGTIAAGQAEAYGAITDAAAELPDMPIVDLEAAVGGLTKAKLVNLTMPLEVVVFDLNPENLTVKYGAKYDNRRSAGGSKSSGLGTMMERLMNGHAPAQWTGSNPITLSFTGIFDQDYATELVDINPLGEDSVRTRIDLLGAWCRPEPGFLEGLIGAGLAAIGGAFGLGSAVNILRSPPKLMFQWGDPFNGGWVIQGYLTSVSAKVTRFSLGGNPLRAEVSISFQEEPGGLMGMLQNPTSGGMGGRRTHTLCQGENLQQLAMVTYGRPQHWRDLADANGIDDPMRVRPGRKVFLPNTEEIGT